MTAEIQFFVNFLRFEKRYSAHTVKAYNDDLEQFSLFLASQYGEMDLNAITGSFVRSWLASLRDEGMVPKTINRKISSLTSFFKYQLRTGRLGKSPMVNINAPKAGRRLPAFVAEKDMSYLLEKLVFPDTWRGRTDKLLINIFYQTGTRLSELISLKETQIDFANKHVKVLGKGSKERIIPLNENLVTDIEKYVAAKKDIPTTADAQFLLITEKGHKLYPKYAYLAVKKYLAQVTTIEKKSPHVLRHSFATHLTNSGADLNAVKELLGHASLASTQVYTHNSIEQLKNVYKKAHPKA